MKIPRGSVWGAVIAIAALADLYVAIRPDGAELSPEVMRAAADAVRKISKPGDVLVHSPLFRVSEVAALGDLRATPHVPASKMMKSRRVVILDRADHPMFIGGGAGEKEILPLEGGLQVRVFEPSGSFDVAIYSLKDALLPGTMRIERPLGTVTSRCTQRRDEGGWSCPKEAEWLYAQQRTLKIDGEDAQCVWAHPTTDGVILFELPAQQPPPAGRKLQLVVSAGLVDDAVRNTPDGASVMTAIVQGGKEKGRVVVPNRVGWFKSTVNVDPGAPIELRITTPKDGRRHHCINAEIVDVVAAEAK